MANRTAQQIAAANAKRVATQQANKAQGVPSVRQQRAAAKAAKAAAAAGQPYTPPPPAAPRAPRASSMGGRRRRRYSSYSSGSSYSTPAVPQPSTSNPLFAPKPSARDLKIVALAALEDATKGKLAEAGVTQDARDAWDKYKKVKAYALGNVKSVADQNEADVALRMAVLALVKLTF